MDCKACGCKVLGETTLGDDLCDDCIAAKLASEDKMRLELEAVHDVLRGRNPLVNSQTVREVQDVVKALAAARAENERPKTPRLIQAAPDVVFEEYEDPHTGELLYRQKSSADIAAPRSRADDAGRVERVRKEVRWFANGMETKLRLNDHKSHWAGATFVYLLNRLGEEVEELRREIASGNMEMVGDEACDVANFAMMIADNAQRVLAADGSKEG